MIKVINLEKLRLLNKKIYEDCSDIKVNQDELDAMLSAIDLLNQKYGKGRISKDLFSSDERKLKKESLKLIKMIDGKIATTIKSADAINKEIESQRIRKV
jgi:hypothetical protein